MALRSKCQVGIKGCLRPLPFLLHFFLNVLHKEFISKWILFNGKFFVLAPRMTFSLAPSPQSLFTFLLASVAYLFIHDRTSGLGKSSFSKGELTQPSNETFAEPFTVCTQGFYLPSLSTSHLQHYNLNTENLQHVCLRLSCKTRSLVNEINAFYGPPPDEFQVSLLCLARQHSDALMEI